MLDKEPMTPKGFEKIAKELERLKNVERANVAREIQIAAQLGDLKENAEYHAAKEKMSHLEKRVALLEGFIAKAQVVDPSTLPHKRVSFGSTVTLLDLETENEVAYTIVGSVESDAARGLISFGSPLARALIGKEEGADVVADLPNGIKEFEIVKIAFDEKAFI
ncbi:MAG: transcription elongation factor GreA [Helicobacteraceae bacterium]|jgi:transcription elongation factor GreA|nr:transcription elongation factor GreA [Helicobacteraceae bacterium]